MSTFSIARLLTAIERLAIRAPARVLAPEAVDNRAGLLVVDGVPLEAGDSVATPYETDPLKRVVWTVRLGAWTVRDDFATGKQILGGTVLRVTDGTEAGKAWYVDDDGVLFCGTDVLTWARDTVGGTAALVPNTIVARDGNGNAAIAEIETSRIHGPDAETLPNAVYIVGGRPSIAHLGKEPYSNVVFEAGIGAQSTNGESAQINWLRGDARDPELGPTYIAAEIGFVDEYGYDPATTESDGASPPGTRTWREKTPRYWRLHATQNTNNGTKIGILFVAGLDMNITAGTLVQFGVTDSGGLLRRAWNNFLPTGADAGDGQGGTSLEVNRYCTTTGAESKNLYIGADGPNGKLSTWDCEVICHEPNGDVREVFRFRFRWLGAPSNAEPYIHGVVDITGGDSRVGKVVVDHNGNTGQAKIRVTGQSGKNLGWTLFMVGRVPPIGI